MTKDEVIELLSEHFTEGMVRTIIDNLVNHEREECAKVCENVVSNEGYVQSKWCVDSIRARGQE